MRNALACALALLFLATAAHGTEQRDIARVRRMAEIPEPLHVRDWREVARAYHQLVLDPATRLDGHATVVVDADRPGFRMPSYLGPRAGSESMKEYLAEKERWFSRSCNNLALYMGNHVGFLGGIVQTTDVPGVLQWDCLATDWFHAPAYPTFLIHNPFGEEKRIAFEAGTGPADLYDAVTHRFVARGAAGAVRLSLPARSARVIVVCPAGRTLENRSGRAAVDGIVVDYHPRGPVESADQP